MTPTPPDSVVMEEHAEPEYSPPQNEKEKVTRHGRLIGLRGLMTLIGLITYCGVPSPPCLS